MSTLHEKLIAATEQPLAGTHYSTGFLKAKVDALRTVVELHTGEQDGHVTWCTECQVATWPCRTIDAIAEALGVPIGEK